MNTADTAAPATVVDRIRKLLALAGNNTNPNEAASAASLAAALIEEYHLAEAELRAVTEAPAEGIEDFGIQGTDKTLPGWKGVIAMGLQSLGVKIWNETARPSNGMKQRVRLFGRKSDVAACAYIYEYLVSEVSRLADAEFCRERRYLNAFRIGAAAVIQKRLREADKAAKATPVTEQALAVIKKDDAELDAKWALARKELNLGGEKRSVRATNYAGFQAGRAAGAGVSIPGRGANKQVGAAPARIGDR